MATPSADHVAIPPWLENSLILWFRDFVYQRDLHGNVVRPNIDFLAYVERVARVKLLDSGDTTLNGPPQAVLGYLFRTPEAMWQVLDGLLEKLSTSGRTTDLDKVVELATYLIDAGAEYEVSADGGRYFLRRRIPPGVAEAVSNTEASVESSSALLAAALSAAYGRDPNYGEAYSKAVKAVESATIPLVIPNDGKATLGKVIGHMRGTSGEWAVALQDPKGAGIEAVIDLMDVLWIGQHDRHGGTGPLKDMTREEAETAVHLAAMLVYWFGRTGIHRTR